jgi:hypothetical protein
MDPMLAERFGGQFLQRVLARGFSSAAIVYRLTFRPKVFLTALTQDSSL